MKKFNYQFGSIHISSDDINELKEFAEELGELAKQSGSDLSKHLNDACFSIDAEYQAYYDLDQDNWDMVHQHPEFNAEVKEPEPESNFKLISNGYDEELLSDRMHIKSGDNADVHLIKTDCGFIIDVYASSDDDYVDSMTIYDEDLNQPNMDEIDSVNGDSIE